MYIDEPMCRGAGAQELQHIVLASFEIRDEAYSLNESSSNNASSNTDTPTNSRHADTSSSITSEKQFQQHFKVQPKYLLSLNFHLRLPAQTTTTLNGTISIAVKTVCHFVKTFHWVFLPNHITPTSPTKIHQYQDRSIEKLGQSASSSTKYDDLVSNMRSSPCM
ncbi:ATV_HP_G0014920.mRNA.1.CDS.1 [Saccharomyces cerevisiae]|nr:ATV_HP_G0014920.mRNA.1.CDS.1 [Saccharomyces cerevisiae]CAI6949877.1 ATV_HP_G0014920.mRNA.1.CDS.1 [Saccharomyces cerevisiae]